MRPTAMTLALVLTLSSCDANPEGATPVSELALRIEPRTIDLGTIAHTDFVVPKGSFLFFNDSPELLYLIPAFADAVGDGKELLRSNFLPFTEVQPEQGRAIEVQLDPRRWRWSSGSYEVFIPLEVSYFYSPPQGLFDIQTPIRRIREVTSGDARLRVTFTLDCDLDGDGYDAVACGGTDCDDTNPNINPGMEPDCATGFDDNCSGTVDDPGSLNATTWYVDRDGDGWGVDTEPTHESCRRPTVGSWADRPGDCHDDSPLAHPGISVERLCFDGLDNDCNGRTDGDDPACGGPPL